MNNLTVAGRKFDGQDGTVRHIGLNGYPYTFFNQPDDENLSEGAHVCLLSYKCHKAWEKFHRFRLNLPYTGSLSPTSQKQYDIWFYGYNEDSSPNGSSKEISRSEAGRKDTISGGNSIVEKYGKAINSGYIHTAVNFIRIHYLHFLFDKNLSYILIPFKKSAKQLWGWGGAGVSCDRSESICLCD